MPTRKVDTRTLAVAYRRLVTWVGVQILLYLGSALATASATSRPFPTLLSGAFAAAMLYSTITVLLSAYRTARAMGSSAPVLWVVAMFLPLLNVISLLVLSSHATAICRTHNIPVGLLGPRLPPSPAVPPPPVS